MEVESTAILSALNLRYCLRFSSPYFHAFGPNTDI